MQETGTSIRKAITTRVLFSMMLSAAVGLSGTAQAADKADDDYTFEQIVITAQRQENKESDTDATVAGGYVATHSEIGLFGRKKILDIPFNTTSFTKQTIENFAVPSQSLNDVLTLNPSVTNSGSDLYNDISIRGFYQTGHTMYVNGVPGILCQSNIPLIFAEKVDVIAGPGTGYMGTPNQSAAVGSVNIVAKKAKDTPNFDFTETYSGKASFNESIDAGRRFGKNNRYGIRITANNIDGENSFEDGNLTQRNLFINADQRTEHSMTNLLAGYSYTHHQAGQRTVTVGTSVTSLPSAPDASKNFTPDWDYMEYKNWMVVLNHEQKLSKHFAAFVNAGYHHEDWYGYVDGRPTLINNAGDYYTSFTNYPLRLTKHYAAVGFKGDFTMGTVKNDYVVSLDRDWYNYGIVGKATDPGTYYGNLYQENNWAAPSVPYVHVSHTATTQMTGWSVLDTLSMYGDKLQVILGVHGHKASQQTYDASTGKQKSDSHSDATCPTYGVVYKATPNVSIYANHAESFDSGTLVSSSYDNAGDVLDPAKTKQNEIGIKVQHGKFLSGISAFEIEQASTTGITTADSKYILTNDGEQKNKGIELSTAGQISKKWNVMAGLMLLDAKCISGSNAGYRVNGTAKYNGSTALEYKADDKFSVLGRATYVGSSTLNQEKVNVPSYVRVDLGVKYKTQLNKTPVVVSAMCYNVTDKNYWIASAGNSSNRVTLANPRTFELSATFSL